MAWQASTRKIPSGNPGNRQTLRAMSALAQRGSETPVVVEAAQDCVRGTPARNDDGDFECVLRDVRRRMRYTHDPLGAEVVKHPAYVIERTNGWETTPEPMDCDDASVLTASMLGALGYVTEFATVAVDPKRPDEWSHVYVRARRNDGRWVPLDPIVPGFGVGDEVPDDRLTAPRAYHAGVIPMSYPRLNGFHGMGAPMATGEIGVVPPEFQRTPAGGGGIFDWLGGIFGGSPTGSGDEWWRGALQQAGGIVQSKYDASRAKSAAKIAAARARAAEAQAKLAGGKPGFFQKDNGETDWVKVGLVGAGAIAAVLVVTKMAKRR